MLRREQQVVLALLLNKVLTAEKKLHLKLEFCIQNNNMKKLMLAILLLLFFACSNDESEMNNDLHTKSEILYEDEIVLGEKLPNPYSVLNMKEALTILKNRGVNTTGIEVETTDVYVRFLPVDTSQLEQLNSNKDIVFFDYPLDYEVLKYGSYYHDPSITENEYTWLYTTVPSDFQYPENIQYEKLEDCFIPKDDAPESDTPSVLDLLEEASFERLGLLEKFSEKTDDTKGIFGTSVYPKGTLKVYDTENRIYEPIKGVKVVGHVIVKWASGYTNESGYYSLNKKFSMNVAYSINYENTKGFTVRYPIFYGIHLMGVHNKNGYSKNIPNGSVAWALSTINNATYDYYKMCSNTGISLPPSSLKILLINGFTSSSAAMLPRVWHPVGLNSNSAWSNFFLNIFVGLPATIINNTILKLVAPDITIGYKNNSSSSYSLYNSTNHELAHASHFKNVGSEYWAKYISYIITYSPYGDITKNNSGICGVGEMWGYSIGNIQTKEKYGYPIDHGYEYWFKTIILQELISQNHLTKKQVFSCLTDDVKSHADLKQKLIEKYPTKQIIINEKFTENGF